MSKQLRIALLGDHNPAVTAHIAIPKALAVTAKALACKIEHTWIETTAVGDNVNAVLSGFNGIWCVPNSPYKNMAGVLAAIRWAREQSRPFLGTCGGYQHVILEYARNVLGYAEADHAEVNPNTSMPVLSLLACSLVEKQGEIFLKPNTRIAEIYGRDKIREQYHCSFGFNPQYVSLFEGSDLVISAVDANSEPRAVELPGHPFFIGTAFQPERSGLTGELHPLIAAFIRACFD